METFVAINKLLRLIGYMEPVHCCGHFLNIILRINCFFSAIFIFLPAFWSIAFEVETFGERTLSAMALICGATNFVAYSIMLLERQSILDMIADLQIQIQRRMNKRTQIILLEIVLISLHLCLYSIFLTFQAKKSRAIKYIKQRTTDSKNWLMWR